MRRVRDPTTTDSNHEDGPDTADSIAKPEGNGEGNGSDGPGGSGDGNGSEGPGSSGDGNGSDGPGGNGDGNGSVGSGGSGAQIGGVAMVTQPPRAADLKVSTQIWPESPSAGDTFTATITIENRFTERVHIKNVEAVLPAELSVELNPGGDFSVLGWLKGLMRRIVTPAWYMPPSTIQILDALQVRQQVAAVSNYQGYETGPLVLSPGSSEVLNVPLRTKKWVFSAPWKHKLDISIDYELLPAGVLQSATDGGPGTNTANNQSETGVVFFEARPPLKSVVIGAITGAVIGASTRELLNSQSDFGGASFANRDWFLILVRLAIAVLLSGIGIIFLSRRTPVQALPIGVEDFWGGLLTGFLVGYFGSDYFVNFLPSEIQTPP